MYVWMDGRGTTARSSERKLQVARRAGMLLLGAPSESLGPGVSRVYESKNDNVRLALENIVR